MATSVSQFGITWTFNADYVVGQYANGDYYVVAPSGLTITDISPASTYTQTGSATVTITNASPAVVTWTGHPLKVGSPVKFSNSGGALPTGITAGVTYYVLPTGFTANSFQISATPLSYSASLDPVPTYGAAVNTSSAGSGTHTCETGRTINGSEINPVALSNIRCQGFDSAYYGYLDAGWDVSLNAARPNNATLNSGNPLVVAADRSLVSTISDSTAGARPQSTDAAILTVVSSAPSAGSFRPSPYGSAFSHTNGWNKSQLDYTILKSLADPGGAPVLSVTAALFQRPWLEWGCHAFFQYCAPVNNGPNYGRELSWDVADGLCQLHLNYSNAQKETLFVRMVQYGIDLYGAAAYSYGIWRDNGGNLGGRKSSLVLAALALNDANIKVYADATQKFIFAEDRQTFYVQQSDVGRVMNNNQGWDRPAVTYIQSDVGMPEAGNQHTVSPEYDGRNWTSMPYRDIIGSSHASVGIGIRLVAGAVELWNWPPFFDYVDRYYPCQISHGGATMSDFWNNMFQSYRGKLIPNIRSAKTLL